MKIPNALGDISVHRLDSGYYRVRGNGVCNYSQPPAWPCSREMLIEFAHPEAGEMFIESAYRFSKLMFRTMNPLAGEDETP